MSQQITFTLAPEDRALMEELRNYFKGMQEEKEIHAIEWLSTKQVAAAIGCVVQNVYRLRRSGEIKFRVEPGTQSIYQYSYQSIITYLTNKWGLDREEIEKKVNERIFKG